MPCGPEMFECLLLSQTEDGTALKRIGIFSFGQLSAYTVDEDQKSMVKATTKNCFEALKEGFRRDDVPEGLYISRDEHLMYTFDIV